MNHFDDTEVDFCQPLRFCRLCGSGSLVERLTLGERRLSAFPATPEGIALVPAVPLTLVECRICHLVQLSHTVDPQYLYAQEYWYQSGVNPRMVEELRSVVQAAARYTALRPGDWAWDIGANDGTLLREAKDLHPGLSTCAWEPTAARYPQLQEIADVVMPACFPAEPEAFVAPRAKLITSIAMFYDVHRPVEFASAVRDALHPDGVWIIQLQDWAQQIAANAWDNVCHEHLMYYTLSSLMEVMARAGLVVLAAERVAINGGSLRVVIGHKGRERTPADTQEIMRLLREERRTCDAYTWAVIRQRLSENVADVMQALERFRGARKLVDLYGASTKGNTFLQVCDIDTDMVRRAYERSPRKVGRYTITGVPIVDEADLGADPPDILLPTIWQFRPQVLERTAHFRKQGGLVLFALPTLEILHTIPPGTIHG